MESPERNEIKVFDYDHGVKDIGVRRYIWLAEYDYVLILQKKKKALFWVTVYYVNSEGRRRVLIVLEERYIVVLEEREKPKLLEFVTAFPADESYPQKIRRESGLIEIKKPQSYRRLRHSHAPGSPALRVGSQFTR